MICPTNNDLRTKLVDNIYNTLSSEHKISKEDMQNHLNLDNLVKFLKEKSNQTKKKFNVMQPKKKDKKVVKFKPNKTIFEKFINICNKNRIQYFRYNGPFSWLGPAIKIFEEQYEELYPLFESIPTESQHGTGFIILHPSVFMSDKCIKYQTLIITPENSDESDSETEVETITWKCPSDGVLYNLNETTNQVYCRQTNELVGKRNELDRLDKLD